SGGGKRGLIIGAIAVIAIGSLGAILVATGAFKSKPPVDPNLLGSNPTTTVPTSTPVPGDTGGTTATADTATSTGPLPTLAETGHGPAPTTKPTGTTKPPPTATAPTGTPTTPPTTPPTATQTAAPTATPTHPPPPIDAAACAQAVKWCNHPANGKDPRVTNLCNTNKPKCLASGGHV
ncbi:MAG: hypothetical protein ABI461_06400, partial [Polyangiaceae bacterium]